jgi:hypothetical protein
MRTVALRPGSSVATVYVSPFDDVTFVSVCSAPVAASW